MIWVQGIEIVHAQGRISGLSSVQGPVEGVGPEGVWVLTMAFVSFYSWVGVEGVAWIFGQEWGFRGISEVLGILEILEVLEVF